MKKVFNAGRLLLQFFPLTVFLQSAFLLGSAQKPDWLQGFMWGGCAAVLQLALSGFFARGYPLNRLILGVNFYLILGGAAVLANLGALLTVLNLLKESGVLLCVLFAGIATTVATRAGFVGGAESARRRDIIFYSVWLLVLACAGVAASFWFRGDMLFSAGIPLTVLSVATRVFKWKLGRVANPVARAF